MTESSEALAHLTHDDLLAFIFFALCLVLAYLIGGML